MSSTLVGAGARISVTDACFVVEQALRGLGAAHRQRDTDGESLGIVHRDVTPSNILVGYDGSVKLTDFGIAKWRLTRSRTQAGFIKGKLKYMSPEQSLREPVDSRSDLFSMGCVLYLAVTGQLPFRGDSDEEILESLRHQEPTPPSHLNSSSMQNLTASYRSLWLKKRPSDFVPPTRWPMRCWRGPCQEDVADLSWN